MCRDNDHGGRRCPNDTSEARRSRRANAAMKTMFAAAKRTPITPAEAPAIPEVAVLSVDSVKGQLSELDELKKAARLAEYQDWAESFSVTVDGQEMTFATRASMMNKLSEMQEEKVIQIGDSINTLAAERTGFTDELIYDKSKAFHREFIEKVDSVAYALAAASSEGQALIPLIQAPALKKVDAWLAQNPGDEKVLDLKERLTKLEDEAAALREESSITHLYGNEEVQSMLKANSEAYVSILGEIRPMGGTLAISALSAKKYESVIQKAAEVYPSAWLDASNSGNEMVVEHASRGMYIEDLPRERGEKYQKVRFNTEPSDYDPVKDGRLGWVKVEGSSYVDPISGQTHTVDPAGPGETVWAAPEYLLANSSTRMLKNGKPAGVDWMQVPVSETVTDPTTGEQKTETVNKWVKPKLVVDRTKEYGKAALQLNTSQATIYDTPGYPTAVHELAHRIEHTGPKFLSEMQSQFIKRRTTDADGKREKLVQVYPGKKEVGREDNFVNKYMGKEYPVEYGGDHHFEVLSTGAEAVFTGRHGGLVGAGYHKPDLDMKRLILGLWASA